MNFSVIWLMVSIYVSKNSTAQFVINDCNTCICYISSDTLIEDETSLAIDELATTPKKKKKPPDDKTATDTPTKAPRKKKKEIMSDEERPLSPTESESLETGKKKKKKPVTKSEEEQPLSEPTSPTSSVTEKKKKKKKAVEESEGERPMSPAESVTTPRKGKKKKKKGEETEDEDTRPLSPSEESMPATPTKTKGKKKKQHKEEERAMSPSEESVIEETTEKKKKKKKEKKPEEEKDEETEDKTTAKTKKKKKKKGEEEEAEEGEDQEEEEVRPIDLCLIPENACDFMQLWITNAKVYAHVLCRLWKNSSDSILNMLSGGNFARWRNRGEEGSKEKREEKEEGTRYLIMTNKSKISFWIQIILRNGGQYILVLVLLRIVCLLLVDEAELQRLREETLKVEDEGEILSVTVHRTDKLKNDFHILHPLVRVHIVDETTGTYLQKQHM